MQSPSSRLRARRLAKSTLFAAAILCAIPYLPAQAQTGPEVAIYGYVAPRCWVAAGSRPICNQGTPLLRSTVRALIVETPIARTQPAGLSTMQAQEAREILVSPQL